MRISIKHLLLGMSLGAVVVFIYGLIKLEPQIKTQKNQIAQYNNQTNSKVNSVEELIKPKIAENINFSINKQTQFFEFYKPNTNIQEIKTDGAQNEVDITPTPGNIEVSQKKDNDPIKEMLEPKVAIYINGNIKTQVQSMVLYRFQSPLIPEDKIQAPTPTPEPTPAPKQSVAYSVVTRPNTNTQTDQNLGAPQDIIALIEKYAGEYGVDKNMMVGIAKCESGFRENAVNGPYAGIYQFVSGTWISNRRAMGLDENLDLRYNAEESVRTAAFKMNRDGFGAWPVCQYKAKNLLGYNTNSI